MKIQRYCFISNRQAIQMLKSVKVFSALVLGAGKKSFLLLIDTPAEDQILKYRISAPWQGGNNLLAIEFNKNAH